MPFTIPEKKQYVFEIFFRDKMPLTKKEDDVMHQTNLEKAKGDREIEHYEFRAIMNQFINDGLLFEKQGYLIPSIKGEKLYNTGGFIPSNIQKAKRYLEVNVLAIIAIIISLLALLIPLLTNNHDSTGFKCMEK